MNAFIVGYEHEKQSEMNSMNFHESVISLVEEIQ